MFSLMTLRTIEIQKGSEAKIAQIYVTAEDVNFLRLSTMVTLLEGTLGNKFTSRDP